MGYLTSITIHNDALDAFKSDPETFARALFEAIEEAEITRTKVAKPFKGFANFIHAEPPRHADDSTIYVHHENTVLNVNPNGNEFKKLIKQNPSIAKRYIDVAENAVREAKESLTAPLRAAK